MKEYPDSLELGAVIDEAQSPRIRGLRGLARMIARDLLKSRRDGKKDKSTTTNETAKPIDP